MGAAKEFDWKAFEEQIEKSTAICANGKRDIKAAISAGKGIKPTPTVSPGQIWRHRVMGVWMVVGTSNGPRLVGFDTDYYVGTFWARDDTFANQQQDFEFVGDSPRDYIRSVGGRT